MSASHYFRVGADRLVTANVSVSLALTSADVPIDSAPAVVELSICDNLAGIQAAVKPASMVNTVPIADAAPGELSHNIPDAISSAVLDLPNG